MLKKRFLFDRVLPCFYVAFLVVGKQVKLGEQSGYLERPRKAGDTNNKQKKTYHSTPYS